MHNEKTLLIMSTCSRQLTMLIFLMLFVSKLNVYTVAQWHEKATRKARYQFLEGEEREQNLAELRAQEQEEIFQEAHQVFTSATVEDSLPF